MNDLRNLQSLKTVVLSRKGGGTIDLSASEFWRRYDAGEFHQSGY
jgi:hypothetical protein